ncbi:hypothetical protein [Streptomyces katrae]|uniref:LigA protein n=1 Tax=Streptomyces katrae TaxID=68223 RepID=A0A0F4JXE2_9ACTN|nr:hypothetical protein [Streptomyces katrae]KJY38494.1 hypothetical protein VR44_03475 [Streptomyces katrae]
MSFEDELGEALRQAGDGFTPDRQALVAGGERRGRRLVVRRRAAVIGGSALGLALIGTAGAFAGGLLGGSGGAGTPNVAAPPALSSTPPPKGPHGTGTGAVSDAQMVAWLKQLLPDGQLTETRGRGTGGGFGGLPVASGVYDDGKGGAAVGVSLNRVDPKGASTAELVACPDKNLFDYDGCTSETLQDGSKIMVFQGYEYPDRRVPTKSWRATLVTPQGYLVDVQEWNAAAEKGAPVSRTDPPLDPARLKTLALSPLWHPALEDLPAAHPESPRSSARPGVQAAPVLDGLLAGYGIPVVAKGGQGDSAYAVLDDGRGESMVSVEVQSSWQPGSPLDSLFAAATVLPDGTKVVTRQTPGEKGGKNVVWWNVDTLRKDGTRVIVSAFNAKNQESDATRKDPALTMAQLKEMATSDKWTK